MDVQQVSQVAPVGLADQQARLAELLRQGPMQPQKAKDNSGINKLGFQLGQGLGNKFGNMGGDALPNTSANSAINAVTPDFQSGSYGAPTMNMTGAIAISPFSGQSSNMMQGFNPAMFKGIF